ncbi:early nodulin-93 isoform X2 [Cryptomeria japonica]|uniref:early nodulin-93 isoform X2 n=1 Tax=Cryptomeria japonica TaxID=3369 RepID=UPI0027DA1051|nr:early nodulin-93 isoform X2 [Cryptomeria japonica]
MGTAREWWAVRRQDMSMAPLNTNTSNTIAQHRAKQYSHEGVKAGVKAATIAFIASAIPLMGARAIPWARANLNYAAQAHIISLVSGAAFFVVADKTILASARKNSFEKLAIHVEFPL